MNGEIGLSVSRKGRRKEKLTAQVKRIFIESKKDMGVVYGRITH